MPARRQPHAARPRDPVRRRAALDDSTTFLALRPVLELRRAELALGVGHVGCSSEATGKLSGIAGLALLGGAQVQREPAAHARARCTRIFFSDGRRHRRPRVAQPDSPLRLVAARLRPALRLRPRQRQRARSRPSRDGKIPPEVDITSPTWFTVLYEDQVDGAGRHRRAPSRPSARRRTTTWSQWAPGVQPLDGDFKPVAPAMTQRARRAWSIGGGERAARAARHPHRSTRRTPRDVDSPLRRERHRDHRARPARRRTTAARSATCRARRGAPTTCRTTRRS